MGIFKIKKSRNDYNPVYHDGLKFRNEKVRDRYIFLKNLQGKNVISDLRYQKRFTVIPAVKAETAETKKGKNLQNASYYYADFTYVYNKQLVVEDVKNREGALTNSYLIKKKLMFYFNRINVIEIYNPNSWTNAQKESR